MQPKQLSSNQETQVHTLPKTYCPGSLEFTDISTSEIWQIFEPLYCLKDQVDNKPVLCCMVDLTRNKWGNTIQCKQEC